MPKLVCVKCEVELKPETNGVRVAEMFNHNTQVYKVWSADKWKCPICGVEVVAGFGNYPLMEHFEGDIDIFLQKAIESGLEVIHDKEVI
jgi:predicted RNA-binding Zn-ribbon protein involved in translation (DUF1610 family)